MENSADGPAMSHVWALRSYRAGETTQIVGLASALRDALGLGVHELSLRYSPHAGLAGLLRGVTLAGIEASDRQLLTAPWPELLISAGLRNEPVARWVRQASGGRTRLVFLGRTWAPAASFDLVVTTPQYRLAAAANVIENPTTLHAVTAARLAHARARFAPLFSALPPPRIGVLVGGDAGPYALRAGGARRLLDQTRDIAAPDAGSILLTTSSRTHPAAIRQLLRQRRPDVFVHAFGDGDNPYLGILAWADAFIVTSDSVAMLSEALATGRPVALFDLGAHGDHSARSVGYRTLQRLGPERLSRDVGIVHERLANAGRLLTLAALPDALATASTATKATASTAAKDEALARSVDRIRALMAALPDAMQAPIRTQ